MPATFEEIMEYHPRNRLVYDEIKRALSQVIPFIGAGLTAPFYNNWGNTIRELGRFITDCSAREEFECAINNDYLDAAQLLEDRVGAYNLSQDLASYFSSHKLTDNWDRVRHEAIYLLPRLFNCPMITTNYDQALEEIYRSYGLALTPLDATDLALIEHTRRLLDAPCVFKLHGSVVGPTTTYDKLVFTRKQYERHYGPQGSARMALKEFVHGRSLLFLGCSLSDDWTLRVLREEKSLGFINYAIVSCSHADRDKRVRQLDDAGGIRAILYEEKKHESVRVILAKLLEDLYPERYSKYQLSITPLSSPPTSIYVYSAMMAPFIGRDKELSQLVRFVNDGDVSFRWWVLTGPGGSGKSRLALELKRKIEALSTWNVIWLRHRDYENLDSVLEPIETNTLVVADYVQLHARELGVLMEQRAESSHSAKLRFLLLERDGTKLEPAAIRPGSQGDDWQEQLFEDVHNKAALKLSFGQSGKRDERFLTLTPLSNKNLRQVIVTFAQSMVDHGIASRCVPKKKEVQALFNRLCAIDPKQRRPLYALFLTGSWMAGKDPTSWSQEDVLDYLIDREVTLLDERIRQVTGIQLRNRRLLNACLQMRRLSTVVMGIPIEILEYICPNEFKIISDCAELSKLGDSTDLLAQLGLVHHEQLSPVEPDIVGEYFVYRWLCVEANDFDREHFLDHVWKQHSGLSASVFFERILHDFKYLIRESNTRLLYLIPPFRKSNNNVSDSIRLSMTLRMIDMIDDQKVLAEAIGRLESQHRQNPRVRYHSYVLAKCLSSLSTKQDVNGATKTTWRLDLLLQNNPNDIEVAIVYSKCLSNLSTRQGAAEATETIARLERLHKLFPETYEVALELAKSLVGLMRTHDKPYVNNAVCEIETLCARFPEERGLPPWLVAALIEMIKREEEPHAPKASACEEPCLTIQATAEEIIQCFGNAKRQIKFPYKMKPHKMVKTISKLERLRINYPNDCNLAYILSIMLAGVSANQNLEKVMDLYESFPDNEKLAFRLEVALYRSSFTLASDAHWKTTISFMLSIRDNFPTSQTIALVCTKALVNYSSKQYPGGLAFAFERLKELSTIFPNDSFFAIELSMALRNLALHDFSATGKQALSELEQLHKRFPHNSIIAYHLACTLHDRCCIGFLFDDADPKKRIEEIYAEFPGNHELAVIVSSCFFNDSVYSSQTYAVDKLEELLIAFPFDEEIALFLAKGLFNLSRNANPQVKAAADRRLITLHHEYPLLESRLLDELFDD